MTNEREKAKQVFAKIIAAYPGELRGRFRLVKSFYYAHLFYWDAEADTLSEHPIVKMDRGPGVKDYRGLIGELVVDGVISERHEGGVEGESERIFESQKPLALDPDSAENNAIIKACEYVAKHSRQELSSITHKESHSWKEAKEGEELDIYRDLMGEEDYAQMCEELQKLRTQVNLG